MELLLILGNQLFDPSLLPKCGLVFMREDRELCTYFRFHKHKIIFFLAAMRTYAEELRQEGLKVHYEELKGTQPYEEALATFIKNQYVTKVHFFEIEDKFLEKRILQTLKELGVDVESHRSPMFLTSREEFKSYLGKYKKPFMKNFYEGQRKRLKILLDKDGDPVGGRWSFDDENRLPLPKDLEPPLPRFASPEKSKIISTVQKLCDKEYADHPGDTAGFWLPVDRKGAKAWLDEFCHSRLATFGPYEDALAPHSDFVFHSVLTPFLNTGLLRPADVIRAALKTAKESKVPIASLEAFVRQVIGWREFIRGIYQNFSEKEEKSNFFRHDRKLSSVWYEGGSHVPILDRTLNKVFKFGYCHHIERLMVLGNLMLLLGVHPKEAHKWFMEMFIDSSDWVMGPNVYGMALFSDGGIFATKPYICGSNYWRKMSKEKEGDWCAGLDGLYWGFISRHRAFFLQNPRLSMVVKTYDKMDKGRRELLAHAGQDWIEKLTVES